MDYVQHRCSHDAHVHGQIMNRLKHYVALTKPGIIMGNLVSVAGGFLLGSRGHISASTFLAVMLGLALVIAGGCVLNNCIDRDIDALMQRTRNRPLVLKSVTLFEALVWGAVLSLCGFLTLLLFTNPLATAVAFAGLVIYAGLYSLGLKRTQHGTWVGSLAGAVPPLAGYCAASNQLDVAAAILFAMYVVWQFPHAYAIAVLHLQDYARASIPVLPLVRGVARVKHETPVYVAAFTGCALLLFLTHNTGWGYLVVLLCLGAAWIRSTWLNRNSADDRRWAKKSFVYSILMIMALSFMMSVDFVAPQTGFQGVAADSNGSLWRASKAALNGPTGI